MLFVPQVLLIALLAGAVGAILVFLFLRKSLKKGSKEIIVNGIRDNALNFGEMYEAVYSVSAGKNAKQTEVFAAWNDAVADCEDEEFKKAFSEKFGSYVAWGVNKKGKVNIRKADKAYASKSRALVKIFFKAGIIRESEISVVADELTAEKYEIVGDAIETDAIYEVLAPYWHLGDDIVDKGVIR